jgi:hypothetical protein
VGDRERVRGGAAAAGVAGWAAAAVAMAVVAAAIAALGACKPEPEPLFSATCGRDEAAGQVKCTILNQGKKEGRACFRPRIHFETGEPLITRRVCTRVLAPGESAEVPALFERMGRVNVEEMLQTKCAPSGQWTCKVDVVETSREMMENQPKSR